MAGRSRGPCILQLLQDDLLAYTVCVGGREDGAWEVEDLLHLSRTCKRFHAIVTQEAGPRWAQLYEAMFKQPMPATTSGAAALQTFKSRYVSHNEELKLKRRVALMRLRSDVQVLEQDAARVSHQLQQEQARRQALRQECAALKRAMQVQSMQGTNAWVPSGVRQQWDVVVTSAPVHPEWRLKQLENDLAASKLQSQVLSQQAAGCKAKLQAKRRKLAVMENG